MWLAACINALTEVSVQELYETGSPGDSDYYRTY